MGCKLGKQSKATEAQSDEAVVQVVVKKEVTDLAEVEKSKKAIADASSSLNSKTDALLTLFNADKTPDVNTRLKALSDNFAVIEALKQANKQLISTQTGLDGKLKTLHTSMESIMPLRSSVAVNKV